MRSSHERVGGGERRQCEQKLWGREGALVVGMGEKQ